MRVRGHARVAESVSRKSRYWRADAATIASAYSYRPAPIFLLLLFVGTLGQRRPSSRLGILAGSTVTEDL